MVSLPEDMRLPRAKPDIYLKHGFGNGMLGSESGYRKTRSCFRITTPP